MLTPQQASEALEKIKDEKWKERRLKALAELPDDLQRIGRIALDSDKAFGKLDWDEQQKEWPRIAGRLDELGAGARLQLFETLFPALGRHVEGAWQLGMRSPYQFGWWENRNGFRAPGNPELTRGARAELLENLAGAMEGFEGDIRWLAAWAPHLESGGDQVAGPLLAAAIDAGGAEGDAVFEILTTSARGEHEVGRMGRHVVQALLSASRPEGWELMERMLLAAQRQEGLRQTILEAVDLAHPEAYRRILRLILENNLGRFSAVVRAVDVWFGLLLEAGETKRVNGVLERVARFLESPAARADAVTSGDAETAYLALWSTAFEDAPAALSQAEALLADPSPERRYVGVHLLGLLSLPQARPSILGAMDDEDIRVAFRAFALLQESEEEHAEDGDLFERLERLIPRFPKVKKEIDPIVWPWASHSASQKEIAAALVHALGKRPASALIPYLSVMDSDGRYQAATVLSRVKDPDAQVRDTLFSLMGDASSWVRDQALEALQRCTATEAEAARLEGFLTRKTGDLRRGVLGLLQRQPDGAALASAGRLTTSSNALQRQAGLELLRLLAGEGRAAAECRRRAQEYAAAHPKRAAEEETHLEALLAQERREATLDDALGLMDPAGRTRPAPLDPKGVALVTPAAVALISSLDAAVHQHREDQVVRGHGSEAEEGPLADVFGYWFVSPDLGLSLDEDVARLPLREVWEQWWERRPAAARDADGFELLRAITCGELAGSPGEKAWSKKARRDYLGGVKLKEARYGHIVQDLLRWMLRLHPPAGAADFLLDAFETSAALVPDEELARPTDPDEPVWMREGWREEAPGASATLDLARMHRLLYPAEWDEARLARYWRLLRWWDEPVLSSGVPAAEAARAQGEAGVDRSRPQLREVLDAVRAGHATEADLYDLLLGPRGEGDWYPSNNPLHELTARKPPAVLSEYPFLGPVVERCRERILEVELARGDTPTAASEAAVGLRCAGGLDTLVRVLQALGRESFVRGWRHAAGNRAAVFSHLARATFPAEGETYEVCAARIAESAIAEQRLVELAVYAPQWAGHVESALGWAGLESGVWWIHAHTKDTAWDVDEEIRDAWQAEVNEHTPLIGQELLDGAVDVAWFRHVRETLGEERWRALDEAAKFASGGLGHKRAQLFADAMLGRIARADLLARIREKRNQDALRALGLLPLAEGEGREPDLLERYGVIQEFLRTSKQFGAMKQESEKRAAQIGMENLARTAGYPDPVRLEWAMEARGIADLASGAATATAGEVQVTLSIDDTGQPQLSVAKAGKPLKSVPPAAGKDPAVAALKARVTEIKRQASRMRLSLENAMCRGDAFAGAELRELLAHPVLRLMLERLVLTGEGLAGYPAEGGAALRDYTGALHPLGEGEKVRVAHPYDLLQAGEWHLWQRECFTGERTQPFKQVFRELYVLTDAERGEREVSRRYAGHQLNGKQAMALLGTRGWVNHPEEGLRRTFHDLGLTAWALFMEGTCTPADVEGLTLEGVQFTPRGEWKPMGLDQVPARAFSEVMRDLDLAVSVAHRGGVGPEASLSTVEMRASLVQETCALLKLENVRIDQSRAFIDGRLSRYTVHLGSAVVHRQPGGHLCIVPVHSQHRGRLFLPFADDDPRTAEVLSKVLLLAKDWEIQDPTILEQIR